MAMCSKCIILNILFLIIKLYVDFIIFFKCSSTVFETEDGMNVSRVVLETLIPNTWIAVDLLNVWTMILNYEEGLKTRVNAKKVYFNVIVLVIFSSIYFIYLKRLESINNKRFLSL